MRIRRHALGKLKSVMSDANGDAGARRGNFASRKARGETGGSGSGKGKAKEHGYDARKYHQNANVHGIHALRTFDCPVCDSKNTIRVTLNPRARQGTVWCTYCSSLRPVPEDLPYPSVQSYVPSLENKADVFFRFNEQYTALLRLHQGDADDAVHGGSGTAAEALGASSGVAPGGAAARKRPGEDVDAQAAPQRPRWEAGGGDDGLFSGIELHTDTGLMNDALLYGDEGPGIGDDGAGDAEGGDADGEAEARGSAGGAEGAAVSGDDAPNAEGEEEVMDGGVDEVDIADFFADAD